MWLLIAEALLALGLLVFIVWWTMFSGRDESEEHDEREEHGEPEERRDADRR